MGKKIETKRLEDERYAAKEQRQASAEYNAYVSSYRSYSEEEMRDFGHTWGPGFGPEDKPVDELADYDKVQGLQLEVLKKMIERNHPDEDINYIFISKCGWDDDYPIDKLGEEYTYEDVLLELVEKYRSEAKFYEEKVDKILKEKTRRKQNLSHTIDPEEEFNEKSKRYMLIGTDGYSIDSTIYPSREKAREALIKAYRMRTPDEWNEDFKDMSYLDDDSAIMYANGENVYVWDIQVIPENN